MWSSLISFLQPMSGYIVGPIINLFGKTIWPGFKKHWKKIVPILLIIGIIGYLGLELKKANDEIISWKNEVAKAKGMRQIAQNTFEVQAVELGKIKLNNIELTKHLKQTERDAQMYAHLVLEYKIKLDSIETVPATHDTMYVNTPVANDSTSRVFKKLYNNELYITGYFQTREPFWLFIDELRLTHNLDIVVSQTQDGDWFGDVITNSSFLKPKQFDIKVVPFPAHWEYFFGGNFNLDKTSLIGVGVMGGIKKGNWGGYVGADFIQNYNAFYKIGIIKYGVLF